MGCTAPAAQLTLAPLEPYIPNCARITDAMPLNVLTALSLHRQRDEGWRGGLAAALDAAELNDPESPLLLFVKTGRTYLLAHCVTA